MLHFAVHWKTCGIGEVACNWHKNSIAKQFVYNTHKKDLNTSKNSIA